jgi:hypothetical protein
MIPFVVVVLDVLAHGSPELPLREEDHAAQALLFDRAHESLRVGVHVRRQLHPVVTMEEELSGSHTPFIHSTAKSWSS